MLRSKSVPHPPDPAPPVAPAPAEATVCLGLALSPHGVLYLEPDDDPAAVPLAAVAARRIQGAFALSGADGLLQLGAEELQTALPPSLSFFRKLGRLFMTALCAAPDLARLEGDPAAMLALPAPTAELAALVPKVPPMTGAEYLDLGVLESLWTELGAALLADLRRSGQPVAAYLAARSPLWSVVGRVCLHLVENRKSESHPFAFMATYASQLNAQARVQHLPLGQALREYAGSKPRLLALLQPLQRAAESSAVLRALVDSQAIFHPQAWTAGEAYRFLNDAPVLESCGLVLRVPDFWRARRRPQVAVTVGGGVAGGLSAESLLDFDVALSIDGEVISPDEWAQILASSDGLAMVKGRWVEVDRERLQALLQHWQKAGRLARDGLSFAEAMRLLAGVPTDDQAAAGRPLNDLLDERWCQIQAGPALARALEGLRDPAVLGDADPGPLLRATLRPYQQEGVRWLWFLSCLGLSGCLADDMGLGKTVQVLALLLLRRQRAQGPVLPALLVLPASLLANWRAELSRFAPDLRALLCHPSAMPAAQLARLSEPGALAGCDVVLTSYGYLARQPALAAMEWGLVVLDEAQAIKNPAAKQTRAVKALRAGQRLALTGTPVENRLGDLWSLFDFLNPGLLGNAPQFARLCKRLQDGGDYGPLRRLVRPYLLRRLKSDKRVIADLPDKTELRSYCTLSKRQAVLYQEAVQALRDELAANQQRQGDEQARRGLILSSLMRLKQICNHPAQHLGSGDYAPEASGKFLRLRELCEPIAARQEKVLVFTQFREMTVPLAEHLAKVFGRPGLVLDGQTRIARRQELVDAFQAEGAGAPPFFVLSLKAGGTGLNLTAASHVIHFDRWWNPAVEDQATDRAYRIGQRRNVLVHKFVCRGTLEERIDQLLRDKQGLAGELLGGGAEVPLTELRDDQILDMVRLDIHSALSEAEAEST